MAKSRIPRDSRSPSKHSTELECPGGSCECRKCMPFEDWHIQDFFGIVSAQRGYDYSRGFRVLDYAVDDDWKQLSGLVKGSNNYLTCVKLNPKDRVLPIVSASCECPVGNTCKHGAALLYHVMHERAGGDIFGKFMVAEETDEDDYDSDERQYLETEVRIPDHLLNAPPTERGKAHPLIDGWVADLKKLSDTVSRKEKAREGKKILYLLTTGSPEKPYLRLETISATKLKTGGYGKEDRYDLTSGRAGFLETADRMVGALLGSMRSGYWLDYSFETAEPELINLLMESIVKTGRCFWRNKDSDPLTLGAPRHGELVWIVDEFGRQRTTVTTPDAHVLLAPSPWYVDQATGEAGPIELPFPADLIEPMLFGPRLDAEQAKYTRDLLMQKLPDLNIPLPAEEIRLQHRHERPTPVLFLTKFDNGVQNDAAYGYHWVKYGETACVPTERGTTVTRNGANGTIVYRRDTQAERSFIERLSDKLNLARAQFPRQHDGLCFLLPVGNGIIDFLAIDIPLLKLEGWEIIYDKNFVDRIVEPDDELWEADLVEEKGWFSMSLDITVKGEKVKLLPLLVTALRSLPFSLQHVRGNESVVDDDFLESLNHGGRFYVTMPDGAKLALPFPRVRSLLKTLIELFDEGSLHKGRLPINAGQLLQLLGAQQPILFEGGERLQELARSLLTASKEWPEKLAPEKFGVVLRDYQKQGVAWLQFIAAHKIGGILADDMGLGKTIEALAHIQLEYEKGRLKRPCLVVCPTSVLPNWVDEVQRLVPDLRVVCLRDFDKCERKEKVDDAHIVLTSYPLMLRDASLLTLRDWHMVILDEAQMIKNHQTLAADVARRFRANHRICMTGTPVENHLGELWSQFAFLMPGLLHSHTTFTKVFRTPIEKHKNSYLRAFLAARIRPFLLRRTKAEVGEELPLKTVLERTIELEGGQRDLYETVRLAMNKVVLEEIAARGINKSQIAILKALLRLRQVCCDPRLVKIPEAKLVKETAKLDVLMELLTPLLEAGRRVLIFSQFTSLLDLVIPELLEREIAFVELRGSTKDRKTPVKEFQAGQAAVFLISLKAGGTGLNLTAADTVIHLDPWWNPAVEEQATDRAHRIGQDKPVFVYRLIVRGSVEEKMLEMQEKKRKIANSIYETGGSAEAGMHFTERDLKYLLAPISEALGVPGDDSSP